MPIKEQKWKVRVHKDKAGKGMFSHMIVSAKTAKEAMQIAADKNKGTDYPYTSSARKLNEEQPEHKKEKEQLKKVKSVNEEQDMPIKELIVSALEETPSDFIETFDQAIRERIHDRIEDARFVTAINMFGDPEEVNEERSGRVKLHYPEHQRNISDDLSSPNSARVLAKEEVNES